MLRKKNNNTKKLNNARNIVRREEKWVKVSKDDKEMKERKPLPACHIWCFQIPTNMQQPLKNKKILKSESTLDLGSDSLVLQEADNMYQEDSPGGQAICWSCLY